MGGATFNGYDMLGRVIELMAASPVHRPWSVADIERLIAPPLALNQYVITGSSRLTGWASYALLSEEAEERFERRATLPQDWRSGTTVYLFDAIAPYGDARRLTSTLRAHLRSLGYAGQPIRFRRTYPDKPWRIAEAKL